MLPDWNPRFEAFVEPARKQSVLWRLGLGLVGTLVIYFLILLLILRLGILLFASIGIPFLEIDDLGNEFITPLDMAFAMLTFVGMAIGVAFSVKFLHDRKPKTLLGPDLNMVWHHAKITFHFAFPLFALWILISVINSTPVRNLNVGVWLRWLPLALPLLLLQVSAEELVFRGYLMQQLAARFRQRWVWLLVPSILFGLLHYEPGELGANAWLVIIDISIFGLIAADLTVRTGNLGAAICLHFTNNLFALLFMTLNGSMTGFSLYVTDFSALDTEVLRRYLIADIAAYAVGYFIYIKIMARRGL